MQKVIYDIRIGRGTPRARQFESFLQDKGHLAEKWLERESTIDGENILFDENAQKIWLSLWDEFLTSTSGLK